MTTRILREPNGQPRRGPTQVIRKRPHVCGKHCWHVDIMTPPPYPPRVARRG